VSTPRDFDVLIAGAGMVGAALAALLATGARTRSIRVALVEPHPAPSPTSAEALDLRVSALSRAAERLLRSVGAWPRLAERQPCAYERMIVWDGAGRADGPDSLVFDAAEAGEANLGHITENRAVAAALIERALEEGVTLLRTPLTGIELGPDTAHVRLSERRVATGLIVAADGADSALREWADIGGTGEAYPQAAVVAHLAPELAHGLAARQRFLPTGPLALLPLADGRVSLVWSTAPEQAAALVAMDDAAFGAAVTAASAAVLGTLAPTTPRRSFPLRRFNAVRYTATRLALVGDSAHSVHPLAGQGVNQGFLDVEALAAVIDAALAVGEDCGDPRVLGRYARERRADNALMGAALDGIWRLFTDEHEFARRGRRYGLGLVNRTGWLKRLLVQRALGS
jgi:2-polyprenylphenol 6-hydroxylase